jgi:hypothetical protein
MKRALIIGVLLIIIGILVLTAVFRKTNAPPAALNGSAETQEDTPVSISLKGDDKEGNPLTYFILTRPFHGSLSGTEPNLTYTPELNFNGVDSITFKVNDGLSDSNSAYFTIMVTPVNDPPTAQNDNIEIKEDVSMIQINVLENDTDIDNDELSILGTANVNSGTTVISNDNKSITYIPNKNFSGTDSFVYTIRDGKGGTNTATARVKILGVNDAPVIKSRPPASLMRIGSKFVYDVEAADTDLSDTLIYSLITKTDGMTINSSSGLIEWNPTKDQVGIYDIEVKVEDSNTASDTQNFTLTYTSPDSPISQTLKVKDGYNNKIKKSLSAENMLGTIQESDNARYEIQGGTSVSFSFPEISIPMGTVISSVVLCVEHYEDRGFSAGSLQWNIGTGFSDNPDIWHSINAPIHDNQAQESADSWDITNIVNKPEKINSFQLQINNNSNTTNQKTFIDNIYVIVKWY